MQILVFYLLLASAMLSVAACVIPAFWIIKKVQFGLLLFVGIILSAIFIYYSLGAWREIPAFYTAQQAQARVEATQLRPIYSRLQRELVKGQLNLAFDPANLDLVLHFANIYSKQGSGVLPAEVKILLEHVLRTAPNQIIALNLLAAHAYKTSAYKQAISYWERILQQFTPEMQIAEAENILKAKIAQAKQFESRQTK